MGKSRQGRKPKENVFRRVAVWRSTMTSYYEEDKAQRKRHYISLDGIIYPQNAGFNVCKQDLLYLKMFNVSQSGIRSGLNRCYRRLKPYVDNWSADPHDFSHWYLPLSIIKCYNLLGIYKLYPWQAECLQKCIIQETSDEVCMNEDASSDDPPDRMEEVRSILYAAPTSGGKSLVAEILMIRAALFSGKASLLVVPHVSLCDERVNYLRIILGEHSVGLKIEAFHSNDCSVATWSSSIDIAVCTIEKANALMNRLMMELMEELELAQSPGLSYVSYTPAISHLGLVVVDELHLVGDSHRGFLLELLLTKLRRLSSLIKKKTLTSKVIEPISIRCVGLSATLPNLTEVADWLEAQVYITAQRPLPLYMYYKIDNKLMQVTDDGKVNFSRELPSLDYSPYPNNGETSCRVSKDPDHLGFLVSESMKRQEQCLVFCATKEWCQKACVFLTRVLPQYMKNPDASDHNEQDDADYHSLIDALTVLAPSQTSVCPIILNGLKQKVSYHHAGMSSGERLVVENAFRRGQLLVLCATSTLAVGVNLPVARVIFRSTQIGRDLLNAALFRQMAGRAGRKTFDLKGEAIVLCSDSFDANRTARLLCAPIEPVQSVVVGLRLSRLILELIVLRLATTTQSILDTVLQESLLAFQTFHNQNDAITREQESKVLIDKINESLLFLYANSTINWHTSDSQLTRNIQPLDALTTWSALLSKSRVNDRLRLLPQNLQTMGSDVTIQDPLSELNRGRRTCDKCWWLKVSVAVGSCHDRVVEATPLGIGIVESASPIPEGTLIFAELYRIRTQGLFLTCELHLLYLISPLKWNVESSRNSLPLEKFIKDLDARAQAVAQYYGITEASTRQISRVYGSFKSTIEDISESWMSGRLTAGKLAEFYKILSHKRFYYALILYDLFHEAPTLSVCRRFHLSYGSLISLKQYGVLQAGKMSTFCERLRWFDLCALFRSLGEKLNSTYKTPESEELRKIDFVQERQAKALLDANIKTLHDAATVPISHLCRAFEELGRSEIPSGKENCEFLLRQTRRRTFLALRIRQSARALLRQRPL